MFLTNLSDSAKAAAIDGLSPERRRALIARATGEMPGVDVSDCCSVRSALERAGAAFEVGLRPLMAVLGSDQAVEVPFARASVRLDTGAPLGVVGEGYGVVQTEDWLAGAELLQAEGSFSPARLRLVDGGRRVQLWGLLGASAVGRLSDGRPDALAHLGCWEVAHDGRASCSAWLYTVRLVCTNGMTARDTLARVALRHTSRAADRLEEAHRALGVLRSGAEAEAALFARLAERRLSAAEHREVCREILDEVRGPLGEAPSPRKVARRERDLEALDRLFVAGDGNRGATAWDSYNALTDWLTARRERFADSRRFARAWQGQAEGHGLGVRSAALRRLAAR